jgi:hypothetical protein
VRPVSEDSIDGILEWFHTRGFELEVAEADGVWWAKLVPLGNPTSPVEHYGRGDTPQNAALRARERYEQEEV